MIKTSEDLSGSYRIGVILIAIFLIIVAMGAIGAYSLSVTSKDAVKQGLEGDGDLALAWLDEVGIIMPLLVVGISLWFIITAIQMLLGQPEAVRWGVMIIFWLMVGSIIAGFFVLYQQSLGNSLKGEDTDWGRGLKESIPLFLFAIVPGIANRWMSRHSIEIYRNQTLSNRQMRMAWNLLLPTMALLIIVAAQPLEETFLTSLTDKRFGSAQEVNFVGLDNYEQLLSFRFDRVECRRAEDGECKTTPDGQTQWELIERSHLKAGYRPVREVPVGDGEAIVLSGTDSDFLGAIGNTVYFTIASVVLELILGLFIAMVVNSSFKGRGLMRAVMLVPWAIPTVVSARLWELMLRDNQSGIINKILIDIGLLDRSQAWLSQSDLQLRALIMVDVWKTTPFMALLLLAGLQLIPADLYEAASVDGANRFRQFRSITLPLLRPTIGIALIFRTLDALRVFDVFNVLLGRQKLSMATYNYEKLIQEQQAGYASAVSVIIFVLIIIFTFLYTRSVKIEAQ